jgi:hypothetical protein
VFANRFSTLSDVFFLYALLPCMFIYMEENLSLVLFSLLIVLLVFNVYDSLLESARLSVFALIARFKVLYLYSILNFYFNSILSFSEFSLSINPFALGRRFSTHFITRIFLFFSFLPTGV